MNIIKMRVSHSVYIHINKYIQNSFLTEYYQIIYKKPFAKSKLT